MGCSRRHGPGSACLIDLAFFFRTVIAVISQPANVVAAGGVNRMEESEFGVTAIHDIATSGLEMLLQHKPFILLSFTFPPPTSSARAVHQMVSYRRRAPFVPDPHELRSCGAPDGELQRRAPFVPDPHELRSCGASDGELQRRSPLSFLTPTSSARAVHQMVSYGVGTCRRRTPCSQSQQMRPVVLIAKRDLQWCRVRLGTQRRVDMT